MSSTVTAASPRSALSCAECRRLKRKCDKQIPCNHCIRRKCPEICPDGRRATRASSSSTGLLSEIQNLLSQHNVEARLSDARSTPLTPRASTHTATQPVAQAVQTAPGTVSLLGRSSPHDPVTSTIVEVGPDSSIHGGIVPGLSDHGRSYDSVIYTNGSLESHTGPSSVTSIAPRSVPGNSNEGSFPFSSRPASSSFDEIAPQLPLLANARALIDAYQKYFTWLHDIVPAATLDRILQDTYAPPYDFQRSGWQAIALLFAVFAVGSLYSLESTPQDPISFGYVALAETCLSRGDFMRKCSEEGLQALHLMGQFYLETRQDRDGDSSWQLWGIAMRVVQTMDLHREDEQRLLGDEAAEAKRKLFWECYTDDIFAANGRMRPSAFQRNYVSARLPTSTDLKESFSLIKYRLSRLSHEILDLTLENRYHPYSDLMILNDKLCHLEQTIPAQLHCQTAMAAMVSTFPDFQQIPAVDRKDLRRTFEQHTIYTLTSASYLFLHRPYYARAIHEPDPLTALFAYSYLIVAERSSVIIEAISSLYELYPDLTARHSIFWYHLFAAAASLGSLIINSPSSCLAPFASNYLNKATEMYRSLTYRVKSPLIDQNFQMLDMLRHRSDLQTAPSGPARNLTGVSPDLVNWEERLLSRVALLPEQIRQPSTDLNAAPPYNPMAFGQGITVDDPNGLHSGYNGDWFQQLWDELFANSDPVGP